MNKIDRLEIEPRVDRDSDGNVKRSWVSARQKQGLDLVHQVLAEHFAQDIVQGQLSLSPANGRVRALLYGINAVEKEEIEGRTLAAQITVLAQATAKKLGFKSTISSEMLHLNEHYLGGGYGVYGPLEHEAISLVAKQEGIFLDPVYTGRAMGGLIDLIRAGTLNSEDTVLFWHTGGTPSLFAYAQDLNS